jgi:hypothetical protein
VTWAPDDPPEIGPLAHHGPELLPFVDLLVGVGLPVLSAAWLARWQSIRARLPGGAPPATGGASARPRSVTSSGD